MQISSEISRPIIKYYGAKWRLAPWIIQFFPEHTSYVEPCGGGASVLLRKPRSVLETYNDINGDVVNFFTMLRDRTQELVELLLRTPYSRAEFVLAKTRSHDDLENARRFFIGCWMSISNQPFEKSTGWRSNTTAEANYSTVTSVYLNNFEDKNIYKVADRLQGVQIESRDARYIIERYAQKDCLVYFDPPYISETRVAKDQYINEVDNQFHIDCAELLHRSSSFAVVSGYDCTLYKTLYENEGWKKINQVANNNSGNKRIESLWLSPNLVKQNKYQQLSLMEF